MDLMEQLRDRAAANPQKVAFFEGTNPKMMETVGELAKAGLADCYLVGDGAELARVAEEVGVDLSNVTVVDVTDAEANEWHKAESASQMDMFNLDIGVYGRVGVNYYITETLWVGVAGQLHGPFFNPASTDSFSHDSDKQLDYGYKYSEIKRKNWNILLHFGIDLD